LTSITTVIIRN